MNKFSCVLMNPPYMGKKHLYFLDKVLQFSDTVISLQPIDTFINMNVSNKISKNLMKYICFIDKIPAKKANELFGILSNSNIGIIKSKISNKTPYKFENNEFTDIIKRIRKFTSIRSAINCPSGIPKQKYYISILGNWGYAKSWHYTLDEIFRGNADAKIAFDTKNELDNFINSVKTLWPYKLMYIIDDYAAVISHLPWLGDYTHEWTDEMLYKKFNITPEEQKEIEDIINYYIDLNKKVDKNWRG